PGRAGERPGPRGDPLDAPPAALLRRRGRHRAAVEPSAPRGRGHRGPPGGDRPGAPDQRRDPRGAHRGLGHPGHRPRSAGTARRAGPSRHRLRAPRRWGARGEPRPRGHGAPRPARAAGAHLPRRHLRRRPRGRLLLPDRAGRDPVGPRPAERRRRARRGTDPLTRPFDQIEDSPMRPDIDLRSYLDTRGAAILLTLSVLLLVGFAALGGLVQPAVIPDGTSDVEFTFMVLSLPLSLIIPVIAVMMAAGEWSDRSLQITFLQRPGRSWVLASKLIAATVVSAVLVALSIGLAAATTWIGGGLMGEGAVFSGLEDVLTTHLLVIAAALLFSLAMGILLQSTVISLVVAIGLPFVISTAGTLAMAFGSELISDIIRAVDLSAAAAALGNGEAGAFELLPLVLLVIVPAALGVRRWTVREVG